MKKGFFFLNIWLKIYDFIFNLIMLLETKSWTKKKRGEDTLIVKKNNNNNIAKTLFKKKKQFFT
jgi:hypothetical protein